MIAIFKSLSPVMQALIATGFTWFVTALGAALVFFFKTIKYKVLDSMLGFAAGVMIAASFWSLLAPAVEMSEEAGNLPWLAPLIGFLIGSAFLKLADSLLPHVHIGMPKDKAEGIKTNWNRSVLLVSAITLHYITSRKDWQLGWHLVQWQQEFHQQLSQEQLPLR